MKYYGDIPEGDRDILEELKKLEAYLNNRKDSLPSLVMAKALVCLGCDYFSMYMEEEGERLFKSADSCCKGYFYAPIFSDMKKDHEFRYLIELTTYTLGLETMKSLGFDEEQI